MNTPANLQPFVALETTAEIEEADAVQSHSRRRMSLVLLLVFWIAALDLLLQRTNFSILYIAPLLLLVRKGDLRHPWQTAALLVGLTYCIYFLKNAINPLDSVPRYFDYRLVNRSLVAIMILVMTKMTELWWRWKAEQSDAEVPEALRYQDQEISATFAVLACIPLSAIIAVVDHFAPANFNLPILYIIPLFVCGWTGSRRLLWSILIVLLALTTAGYLWGGAPPDHDLQASLTRNRLLAAAGMIVVSTILHFWMSDRDGARGR